MVRRIKLPSRHALLYAMNPLVIIFISGQGHMDSMVVCLLLCALVLSGTGYRGLTLLHSDAPFWRSPTHCCCCRFLSGRTEFVAWHSCFSRWRCWPFTGKAWGIFWNIRDVRAPVFLDWAVECDLRECPGVDSVTSLCILSIVLFSGMGCIFFLTPLLIRAADRRSDCCCCASHGAPVVLSAHDAVHRFFPSMVMDIAPFHGHCADFLFQPIGVFVIFSSWPAAHDDRIPSLFIICGMGTVYRKQAVARALSRPATRERHRARAERGATDFRVYRIHPAAGYPG